MMVGFLAELATMPALCGCLVGGRRAGGVGPALLLLPLFLLFCCSCCCCGCCGCCRLCVDPWAWPWGKGIEAKGALSLGLLEAEGWWPRWRLLLLLLWLG